jgi:hypothetical protein
LQNILRNFFVAEVFNKNSHFNVLLMIIEVNLTFLLRKSSGLKRKQPLPRPPPTQGCARGGGEVDLFII